MPLRTVLSESPSMGDSLSYSAAGARHGTVGRDHCYICATKTHSSITARHGVPLSLYPLHSAFCRSHRHRKSRGRGKLYMVRSTRRQNPLRRECVCGEWLLIGQSKSSPALGNGLWWLTKLTLSIAGFIPSLFTSPVCKASSVCFELDFPLLPFSSSQLKELGQLR